MTPPSKDRRASRCAITENKRRRKAVQMNGREVLHSYATRARPSPDLDQRGLRHRARNREPDPRRIFAMRYPQAGVAGELTVQHPYARAASTS